MFETRSSSTLITAAAAAGTIGALVYFSILKGKSSDDAQCDHGPDDENCRCLTYRAKCIYLDYNGTTPVHPGVVEAMMPYLTTHYGNPSSPHMMARQPRWAVNRARISILHLLGVVPPTQQFDVEEENLKSILFTACGTESDNLAIHLAIKSCENLVSQSGKKPHIVTSNVEHPAIAACLETLVNENKIDVTWVEVNIDGQVKASDMIEAIRPNETVLVTLMLANNEVGSLQPVAEVAKACRERGVLFHTDAAQAVGKVSVSLEDLGHPDMISIVGHKIGAPKGIAALYVRPKCLIENNRSKPDSNTGVMLIGGNQEYGFRGGTANVPYIVGMGKAIDLARKNWEKNAQHTEKMRALLLKGLQEKIHPDWIKVNGPVSAKERLPNTLSIGFKGVQGSQVVRDLYEKVAMSTGATCHSTGTAVSSVLQAMKVPESFGRGTLRLSLGPSITEEEIEKATAIIARAVEFYISENDSTYILPKADAVKA